MSAERKYGYDQQYYDWSPISTRSRLTWPNKNRMALCVILSVEHYEWVATNNFADGGLPGSLPEYSHKSLELPGGVSGSGRPYPDVMSYGQREYGKRVGIFRVMDILDNYGIRATVAIDASTAANYPFLIKQFQQRDYEMMAHGIAVNQMISSNMTQEEEREYIRLTIDAVTKATGSRPLGWFGPEYGESENTVNILADEGIQYVCDWPNDEQPYPMKTSTGSIYSLPILLSLDDQYTHWINKIQIDAYTKMITDSFDVLYRESADTGRMMVLNFHPWILGTPFRSKYLEIALRHISKHDGIWNASASEIVDWHRSQTAK